MAFLVPSGALDGPSPGVGALTGLAQGLREGLLQGQQNARAQQQLQIQQQEQALRERAYAHGLTQESEQDQFFQSLGKLSAIGQTPSPTQGPPTPAQQPLGAGEQGPMPQAGAQLPPEQRSWLAQAQDIAQSIKSPKAYEAFQNEVHLHLAQTAVKQQAETIISDLHDRRMKGAYRIRKPGGVIDESGDVAAQGLEDQARQFMAGPGALDPQAAATFLDHLQQSDVALRKDAAAHDTEMALLDHTNEDIQKAIDEERASGNGDPSKIAALVSIQSNLAHSNMTREEAGKALQSELSGEAGLKRKEIQSRIDWEGARAKAQMTPDQRIAFTMAKIQATGASRMDILELEDAAREKRQQERIAGSAANVKAKGEADAAKTGVWTGIDLGKAALTSAQNAAGPKWDKMTPEEKRAKVAEARDLLQTGSTPGGGGKLSLPDAPVGANAAPGGQPVGPSQPLPDDPAALLQLYNSGKVDWPTVMQKAKALKFESTADFLKAAQKK